MQIRVFLEVSDKYDWLLTPFSYLFNTFWSALQEVVVFGYTPPKNPLPENFRFHSIDRYNYPAENWSDGFIKFLSEMKDDFFVLFLPDYWLVRQVDYNGVNTLADYIASHPDVLRLDLTNDRLHARGDARDALLLEHYGHYDMIVTPPSTAYNFSTQAGIWNREHLLEILQPGRTPWETEMYTEIPPRLAVLGTAQWPVRYCNVMKQGKLVISEINKIPKPHKERVLQMIPDEVERA